LRKHIRYKSKASRLDLPDKPSDKVNNNVSGEASSEVSFGENN
jgi:hypothetical protein